MDITLLILASAFLSITLPPFGAVLLWDRRSFLADTIAHSAILGAGIGLFLPMGDYLSLLLVALAVTFFTIVKPRRMPQDAWLIFISSGLMALGNLLFFIKGGHGEALHELFFGDIFLLSWNGLVVLALICVLGLAHLYAVWPHLLLMILNEDLLHIEKRYKLLIKLMFNICLALVVSVSIHYLGMLLLSAFLILPPVIGQRFAKSPVQTVGIAILVAIAASGIGLVTLFLFNLPFSSMIVLAFWGIYLSIRKLM